MSIDDKSEAPQGTIVNQPEAVVAQPNGTQAKAKVLNSENFTGVTSINPEEPESADATVMLKRSKLDKVFNELWGVGEIQNYEELRKRVDAEKVRKGDNGQMVLKVIGGGEIAWGMHAYPDNQQYEFIGKHKGFILSTPFNQNEADAVIAVAVSRGWNHVNVQGDHEHKEMMWLAAQRAGVAVKNFTPAADSPVVAQFYLEQQLYARQKSAESHGIDTSTFAKTMSASAANGNSEDATPAAAKVVTKTPPPAPSLKV